MNKFLILFLSICFLFSSNQAKATHLLGGEMQWKCLGNDTFLITLVIYRRCTDGAVTLSVYAPTITSDSCANSYNIYSSLIQHDVEDITPLCSTQPKLCPSAGGTGVSTVQIPFGVEKHTMKYKVYLGGNFANCCWYRLYWEQSARNSNITTGYADGDFYFYCWLNRCVTPCDNSPEFRNQPIAFKNAGQDAYINNDVHDVDGDSLSYYMVPPLGGSYISPWSYSYPLTCFGGNVPNPNATPPTGFNLDSRNGDIFFRPMQVQITVLKMLVTEWRKNSLGVYSIIGITTRDMQLVITSNNANKLPALSGPFSYEVCSGQQLCIPISTSDSDATDTSRISWNKDIPSAQWNDNNGIAKNATGTLCWTPTDNDARTLPYYFVANAYDDHCPLLGISSRAYSIIVSRIPAKPTITKSGATLHSTYGPSYQWYLNNSPLNGATDSIYTPSVNGYYKVKTGTGSCFIFSDSLSFTVGIKSDALSAKINISPNPFHNQLSIEIKDFDKPVSIFLYDTEGKLILKQLVNSKGTCALNLSSLSNGIYLLEVNDGESKATYKVEKQ